MELKSNKLDKDINLINSELQAYQTIMKLKNLFRQGWLKRNIPKEACESVADHSFGTAILAILITPEHLNKSKVISMMLLHEAGEALIGDIIPQDNISPEQKRSMESHAVHSIFSQLDKGNELINLWQEFETGTTPEAIFARDLDKFEMAMQANFYGKALDRDLSEFMQSALKSITAEELKKTIVNLL